MRYVILIAYAPGQWEAADAAGRQRYFDAHDAFHAYVTEHGRILASAALADADTATTVRPGENRAAPTVTDGPFVELTEQIGGYYDVELPDLDVAIAAAGLLHPSYVLEIRPVTTIEGYDR